MRFPFDVPADEVLAMPKTFVDAADEQRSVVWWRIGNEFGSLRL